MNLDPGEGHEPEHVEAEPSLRESLAAAFSEGGEGASQTPATESPTTSEHPDAAPAAESRARAADGKFAPKPVEAAQAAASPLDGQPDVVRAPASWSAPAKAKFATIDPLVQAEIAKRERDVDRGLQDRAQQLAKFKPIDDVLAPHRERIALSGQDEASYVRALVTADEMLRGPNKVQTLQRLADIYGIQFPASGGQGQQQRQQPPLHPAIVAMQQELQGLRQTENQRQQAETAAQSQQVQAHIQAFSDDPKNVYFANVKEDMRVLLSSGRAETLDQAYDMACHMRPDIRVLVGQPVASDPARSNRTQAARQASVSVTGAPGPGSAAPAASSNISLRDELKAQFRAA